jgi:hypothetical protein
MSGRVWISLAGPPKASIMWENVEKVAKSGEKWGKWWITVDYPGGSAGRG